MADIAGRSLSPHAGPEEWPCILTDGGCKVCAECDYDADHDGAHDCGHATAPARFPSSDGVSDVRPKL